jgi:transcriptional regulator with XRE-family HTH domain
MTLGEMVKNRRDAAGTTQANLAEQAEVSVSTVIRLETKSICSWPNLVKIARVLDLSLDVLAAAA